MRRPILGISSIILIVFVLVTVVRLTSLQTKQESKAEVTTPIPPSCGASINGYIWNDVNMNGVWENETEPGVNDIHVLLEDSTGKAIIPEGCVDTNGNGRIDVTTTNEIASSGCQFWPVAITGGNPRSGVSIAVGTPYYASGVQPGYLKYQHIWNPVVSKGVSQVSAIQKRLPDLTPRPDIDYTGQYLYSQYSGYYEFQNVPVGAYKLRVLTSIWEQENWGVYPIDNQYYFPFPRPLQFTAPQYKEVDVTISTCGMVVTVP